MTTEATITTSNNGHDNEQKPYADDFFIVYASKLKGLIDQHKAEPTWDTNHAVLECLDLHAKKVRATIEEHFYQDEEFPYEQFEVEKVTRLAEEHHVARVKLHFQDGGNLEDMNNTGLYVDDPLLERLDNSLSRALSAIYELKELSDELYNAMGDYCKKCKAPEGETDNPHIGFGRTKTHFDLLADLLNSQIETVRFELSH